MRKESDDKHKKKLFLALFILWAIVAICSFMLFPIVPTFASILLLLLIAIEYVVLHLLAFHMGIVIPPIENYTIMVASWYSLTSIPATQNESHLDKTGENDEPNNP